MLSALRFLPLLAVVPMLIASHHVYAYQDYGITQNSEISIDAETASQRVGTNIWVNDHIGFTADINPLFDDEDISEPYANAGIIFRY